MFIDDLKVSLGRGAQLAVIPTLCAAIAVSATSAMAIPVACGDEPTCEVLDLEKLPNGDYLLIAPECPEPCLRSSGGDDPCADPLFCVLVDSPCPTDEGPHVLRVSLRPDIDPGDPSEDVRMISDDDNPQRLCFEIPGICEYEEGEDFEVEILVDDLANDKKSSCIIKVRVVCGKRPRCYFNDEEREPRNDHQDEMMQMYEVTTGDILPVIEVCARSRCENRSRVEMFSRPPFMDPMGHAKSSNGGKACIESKSNDVVEGGFAEGTYWAKFRCTDLFNGRTRVLKVGYKYTDSEPEPEPEPVLACAEDEALHPNDKFADASVIDAGECADAFGVNIYGKLDMPIHINGDVDYYSVVGLTPGRAYEATIVAGMNPGHAFTDTMLGWLSADGVVTAMDDNDGPLEGYSKISFAADANGAATLAITGHGDSDFDGMMDISMPYEEYGFGGYMLSIRVEDTGEMTIERQADLNGDGDIDASDLGLLLGLFGIASN